MDPLCMTISKTRLKSGTGAKAEASILWSSDMMSWLIGKNPDAGKDWGHEEKLATEDEMVGWLAWLSGHEFEQTPGSLVCCSPWGHKELDKTEWVAKQGILKAEEAQKT